MWLYVIEVMKDRQKANKYYLIAMKHDRHSEDGGQEHLYKNHVRFWCKKSLKRDNAYPQAWALLADVYSWIALVYAHPSRFSQKIRIKRLERGIFCIKQAIKHDPNNYEHEATLKKYYHIRNEEYKSEWQIRII